jgi:hypothetical protein
MKAIFRLALSISLLSAGPLAHAQQNPIGSGNTPIRVPYSAHDVTDAYPRSPVAQEQLEKVRQTDRQKKMIADTNRLLMLAAQLKSDTNKATGDATPADTVRRAEEIEKLARNIKERMKN